VSIRVFVEGGGDANTKTACRKAFHVFFEKVLSDRPRPRITASGSRDEAYRDFCRSLSSDPNTFAILLVDSEDPVPAGKAVKAHLRDRDPHWTGPMPDEQVYLMVQCMEAWFLADKPALRRYYSSELNALPGNPNIEEIPKPDVLDGLRNATRGTNRGPYHKTHHGFDILERIDPAEVGRRSLHADALFQFLLARLR
jgi:hypothetical protein